MSIAITGPLALHGAIQPLYCGACQMRRYSGHAIKCPYHKKMTNKQASKAEQQVVAKNIMSKGVSATVALWVPHNILKCDPGTCFMFKR